MPGFYRVSEVRTERRGGTEFPRIEISYLGEIPESAQVIQLELVGI